MLASITHTATYEKKNNKGDNANCLCPRLFLTACWKAGWQQTTAQRKGCYPVFERESKLDSVHWVASHQWIQFFRTSGPFRSVPILRKSSKVCRIRAWREAILHKLTAEWRRQVGDLYFQRKTAQIHMKQNLKSWFQQWSLIWKSFVLRNDHAHITQNQTDLEFYWFHWNV